MSVYEESDEYCPHCDNHYVRLARSLSRASPQYDVHRQVIEAKTPQAVIGVEAEDTRIDSR